MTLQIGNKPLKELTAEDLKQIVMIEGCCPVLEFWKEPDIIDSDNQMFSDTVVLDYTSSRIEDGLKSSEFSFFFKFKNFSFHYTKDYELNKNQPSRSQRISVETFRFLIKQGYDVPLYEPSAEPTANAMDEKLYSDNDIETVGKCANCGVEFHIHKKD